MSDLHDLTALEQRDALRRREFSSTELTDHYLARIDRYGAELGAFVEVTHDLARAEAGTADAALQAGEHGPLTGLPLAFKDLSAVAGVRMRMGSTAVNVVPSTDGPIVGRLRKAGVVTVGTTHAPELGPTCFTHSAVVDRPAVTPYATTRYASGSSGGAAAAVAAGLLPLGHASDGAGSIRTPAATCGLVGFKPSRGRLPATVDSYLAWVTEGPITRTVADAALMLDVMASGPHLYPLPDDRPWSLTPPRPLKILCYTDSGIADPDQSSIEAVNKAAALLTSLGHEVVDSTNPVPWDDALLAAMRLAMVASVSSAAQEIAPGEKLALLHPYTRWCVRDSQTRTAVDFFRAQQSLASAAMRMLQAVTGYDAVLCPTTAQPPMPVGYFSEQDEGEGCLQRMLAWSAYTPVSNLAGQPAVSLPLHATAGGLPVGVQLIGSRVGDDGLLLQLAAQVEAAAPFANSHPVQW